MVAFMGKVAADSQVLFTSHRNAVQDMLLNVCNYQTDPL